MNTVDLERLKEQAHDQYYHVCNLIDEIDNLANPEDELNTLAHRLNKMSLIIEKLREDKE